MTMKRAAMMLAAPAALAAVPADAAVFRFAMTGAYQAQFTVPSDALTPPVEIDGDFFVVEDIAGTFGGRAQTAPSITFNTAAFDGGLTIELLDGEFAGFLGQQLFTGTTAAPVLRTGTFTLRSDVDNAISTLTIAQVPEPATWALMILGFGAVGGAMRRRGTVRTTVRIA